MSDLSNDQGQPTKVLGQSQKAHTGRHDTPLERDASEVERMRDSGQVGGDYSSDGTLTESEDDGDGKPITSAVVKNSEDQSSQVIVTQTGGMVIMIIVRDFIQTFFCELLKVLPNHTVIGEVSVWYISTVSDLHNLSIGHTDIKNKQCMIFLKLFVTASHTG